MYHFYQILPLNIYLRRGNINSFLKKKYTTGIDIRGYKLLDNELNSGNRIKDYRLDILLEKENHLISIEMNQYVYPIFILRMKLTYIV
mgnify:CR=1 FL=1